MKKNIEDIYALSPTQQGILFHTLYAPKAGMYFEQIYCTLEGEFNAALFKQAWEHVIARHAILRTAFYWEELESPVQIVHKQVVLPWSQHDWRPLSQAEQQTRLDTFLQQDREQGFTLTQAPLMRCAVIQLQTNIYQFIWSHHHILLDGWCLPIVLREVLTFYTALRQRQLPRLDRPRPYRDYISWLQQQDLAAAERFWRAQLHGFTTPTTLNLLSSTTPQEANGTCAAQLTATNTLALQSLAQQHRLTLNTLIQGAWAILLSRYSGEEDIVFGATTASRPPELRGVETMVGLFINTLPLRVQVTSNTLLINWLQALQQQQSEWQQYAYTPLVKIQEWSAVPRTVALFDSLVVFENYPVDDEALQANMQGLIVHDVQAIEKTNYAITLMIAPGKELGLRVLYDTNRFHSTAIKRLIEQLQQLLISMLQNSQQPLAQLSLLTDQERDYLLTICNDTDADYPQQLCVHHLVDQQAEKTPEAIAIIHGEQSLTYQVLQQRTHQLAQRLQQLGVQPNTLVGICAQRSVEMLIGVLAILKAGGVYVPLDPTYPTQRLAAILEDAQLAVLLTQTDLIPRLPPVQATIICLDQAIDTQSVELINIVTPQHLAYVLYTSGSTGKPKGVAMPHRALVNLMTWQSRNNPTPQRTLQFASLNFDVSFQEIFTTWCIGGTLVLIQDEIRQDAIALLNFIQQMSIERLFLPYVALQQLAQAAELNRTLSLSKGTHLTEIITAGEQLQITSIIRNFFNKLPHCTLHNHYGPTESHVVTAFTLTGATDTWATLPPIGKPIANTQIYILDASLQPVPIGVAGELHIGGIALAAGYLNHQELTAEKFIANPFKTDRLYKTGDLARYLPDGNIEYLGRIDHQVKIRGFRVELGEIEAILNTHPQIQENVVVAIQDAQGLKRLIAYYVPAVKTVPFDKLRASNVQELREFLKQHLPDYMLPAVFIALEKLPLTPSGKVNRRALPAPDSEQMTDEYIAPHTPTEQLVAVIWGNVLGLTHISRYAHFFEIGGHSLLATQVMSRLRETFGVEIPLQQLFATPTLAGLSEHIDIARQFDRLNLLSEVITSISRSRDLPLSYGQERLWFLSQLEGNNAAYNIPLALRLQGTLNRAALEQSLQTIIQRHEILRTYFVNVNGRGAQRIVDTLQVPLTFKDLQHLAPAEQSEQIHNFAEEEAQQPFALSTLPLLRVTLLQLSSQAHVLLLTIHHIIADGWSLGILLQELIAAYTATPLPVLTLQYVDFAAWQRHHLMSESVNTHLNFWVNTLRGIPPLLELPTDYPRPAIQTFRGKTMLFTLNPVLTQQLHQLGQQTGTTLFMTLLTAIATLLAHYTRQTDIVIGSPIANRNRQETENLIGFFVNTLVLRCDLSKNLPVQDCLKQIRQLCLDCYTHQDVPFEQLVEKLQPTRSLSYTPLFQVMFILQNTPVHTVQLPDLTIEPLAIENVSAKYDLTISLEETPQGLAGSVEYNADLFATTTLQRFIGHLQTLLQNMVTQPDTPILNVPYLTNAELQQFATWNNTTRCYSADCLPQLFAEQAAKTPDATAIVFEQHSSLPEPAEGNSPLPEPAEGNSPLPEPIEGNSPFPEPVEGNSLTYQALNQRANQLAHYLISLGVKPDILVGICVERGLEMVISLLAILKAGGAYIPLDPNYPIDRLALMLEDAKVSVLLTQTPLLAKLPQQRIAHIVCLDSPAVLEAIKFPSTGSTSSPTSSGNENELSNPNAGLMPNHLAYVIYTSGSTGKPKGVQITHGALSNFLHAMQTQFQLTSQDTLLAVTTISFDIAGLELYLPLIVGAKIVISSRAVAADGTRLLSLLESSNTTLMQATPATWRLLLAAGWQHSPRLTILCGGEALPHELAHQLLQRGKQVWNMYGPTETTIWSTMKPIKSFPEPIPFPEPVEGKITIENKPESIGSPIANTQLFILDTQLQPVPIGVTGELHIGGQGLARGYLHRPELTAEKFIQWKQARVPIRLYKTGDLARYLPNGDVEYLGRLDNQVKLRGFRIELGEIETVLEQQPTVNQAVVSVNNEQLVAYIVPKPNQTIDSNIIRQVLKHKLPDYMLPTRWVILETLPLTQNGKVDRRALPVPDNQSITTQTIIAPRNAIELQLAQIWQQVLGIPAIGVRDNFFEQGGHSLLAVQLMAHIQQRYGKSLPLATLFQATTIEQLAEILQQEVISWSSLVAIQPQGQRPPFFCVPGSGGNPIYFHQLARYLGADQPFYALQAVGLDGITVPMTNIEEMASHYVQAIQTIQAQGPYWLGGHSFGAYIAFEMAQQLIKQGQAIALLTIFDTQAPPLHPNTVTTNWDDATWISNIALDIGAMFGKHLDISYHDLQPLAIDAQITYLNERLIQLNIFPPTATVSQLRGFIQVYRANLQTSYLPQNTAQVPILLCRAKELAAGAESIDSTWGWEKFCQQEQLVVQSVFGNHITLFTEPHVQELATILRSQLIEE